MTDESPADRIGRQNLFVLEWFRAQRSLPAMQQELRDLRNRLAQAERQLDRALRATERKAEPGFPVRIERDHAGQMYIRLKESAPGDLCFSRKVGEHVVLDSDENGTLVGIELLGMEGISELKPGILTDRNSPWFEDHAADGEE